MVLLPHLIIIEKIRLDISCKSSAGQMILMYVVSVKPYFL